MTKHIPGSVTRTDDKRMVRLIERKPTTYPELWCSVLLVGSETSQFPRLLSQAGCWGASSVEDADIVLFTGGVADVSPELYGETKHNTTMSDPEEDVRDILVFKEAANLGVPMIGVCRGAQFGHVMNGGKLYQHIDGHNSSHEIYIRDSKSYLKKVSSVHHQCCVPNEEGGMKIIAEAYESTGKWLNQKDYHIGATDFDVEAFWYPDTAFLGIQGHPEYDGFPEFSQFFIELVEQYIATNPEIKILKGKNRLPKDVLDNRKWRLPATVNPFIDKHIYKSVKETA